MVVNNRFKRVEFETEDGQIVWAKVRTSLTNEEIEALVAIDLGGNLKELHEGVYPYVTEWNVLVQDRESGDIFEVVPPAEGGPESFKYAPNDLALAIVGTLIHEPFAKVDPKSLKPVESTE